MLSVCLLEIQFSLGKQYSVVFYYNKGNMKVNLIQLSFLRNNQANDYLGTKTHLLITLKAPADCSIQPTLTHVPEWCQPQRLDLILVFSTISLFHFIRQLVSLEPVLGQAQQQPGHVDYLLGQGQDLQLQLGYQLLQDTLLGLL